MISTVHLGSLNSVKLEAVRSLVVDYPFLRSAEIRGVSVSSGVSEQPRSIDETVTGAIHRAKAAFQGADLGVGLEGGVMQVSAADLGYLNVCAGAFYDGTDIYVGLSPGFLLPGNVQRFIHEGLDLNQAMFQAGLTEDPHIGASIGAVGVLTRKRVCRMDYNKLALQMAIPRLEAQYSR